MVVWQPWPEWLNRHWVIVLFYYCSFMVWNIVKLNLYKLITEFENSSFKKQVAAIARKNHLVCQLYPYLDWKSLRELFRLGSSCFWVIAMSCTWEFPWTIETQLVQNAMAAEASICLNWALMGRSHCAYVTHLLWEMQWLPLGFEFNSRC